MESSRRWASQDRRASSGDQSASELDQTSADSEQTASDSDQEGSARDQALAQADQVASDRDQVTAERELSEHPLDRDLRRRYEASSDDRATGTAERKLTALVREQVAKGREQGAIQRDRNAWARDRAAAERDRAAQARDRDTAERLKELGSRAEQVEEVLEHAQEIRERAAADRVRAAGDRERAAKDRREAMRDREHLLAELGHAQLDALTGVFGRDLGQVALRNEIERARRDGSTLVLAYVDVDGLKDVNDARGHAAGDTTLRTVVSALRSNLRPYDPIVRWGGDEFVCAMAHQSTADVDLRFEQIRADLSDSIGTSISSGVAELEDGDGLDALLARADDALYEAKQASA
jgi:diguanylate cyclase (GGDEF)-like protein